MSSRECAAPTRLRRARARGLRLGPAVLTLPATAAMLVFFVAPLAVFFVYSFLTAAFFDVSPAVHARRLPRSGRLRARTARSRATRSTIGLAAAGVNGRARAPDRVLAALRAPGAGGMPVLFLITASIFASYLVRIYAWRTILGEQRGHQQRPRAARRSSTSRSASCSTTASRSPWRSSTSSCRTSCSCCLPAFGPLSSGLLEAAQDLGAGAGDRAGDA